MKRLIAVLGVATVGVGLLSVGSAMAKELVLRPKLVISVDQHACVPEIHPAGTLEGAPITARIGPKLPCGQRVSTNVLNRAYEKAYSGYAIENTSENVCERHRKIWLYLNGVPYGEPRELGEFHEYEAIWFGPSNNAESEFADGHYELVSPRVAFFPRVYKTNGPPQDEAKSYQAKVICERLTLDVGSFP